LELGRSVWIRNGLVTDFVSTGTVMRAETLRSYATSASFRGVEVLPIDDFFFRFCRLNL
jgi:hypothetical protein